MDQVQKNAVTSPFPKPKHEECLSVSLSVWFASTMWKKQQDDFGKWK